MSKKFYISDTHFGHANIIDHADRPFKSVEKMDATMIRKWNKVVGKNDLVYHLGDFAWNNIEDYRSRLNGHIILIRGNHDKAINKKQERELFSAVYDYKLILDHDYRLILFHYPIMSWDGMLRGRIHLHGHIHDRNYDIELPNGGQRINISVEQPIINYTPRTIEKILK